MTLKTDMDVLNLLVSFTSSETNDGAARALEDAMYDQKPMDARTAENVLPILEAFGEIEVEDFEQAKKFIAEFTEKLKATSTSAFSR